jgi:hypothetical protein
MNSPGDHRPEPKGPNFPLIVLLAGIVLAIGLIASFYTIDWDGKRLVPRAFGKHAHPTSQMLPVNPVDAAGPIAA